MPLTVDQMITRCGALKRKWLTRNTKFVQWYNLLTLKDELEQEGMETVVSNDPRTGYNLALHLLTSSLIAHRIPSEDLTQEEIVITSPMEKYITQRWADIESNYRSIARQSWIRELASLMLSLGWYAVLALIDNDSLSAEVWHPADVYPDFGDTGLTECSHIYPLSASSANRKVKSLGWAAGRFTGPTTLYDYWTFDEDGDVANGIVLGGNYVKPMQKHPEFNKHGIPIFTGPVGGLPDRGSIQKGTEWQKHFGESILATNEAMTLNYNKMLSFIQQVARNAANPKWLEKSSSDTQILTEEQLNKFGAIFRMGPNDEVGPMASPPIPVELKSALFDYQNMLQRGLFPSVLFGNIQQQIAGYAMSQIATAAIQVLTPYHEGIKGLLADIDNFWLSMAREHGYKPYGLEMPDDFPKDAKFKVDFSIDIPGYLIQRATTARMLDPTFKLSTQTVMELMFHEIKDPLREQARARKDEAMSFPEAIMVDAIRAYREQAKILRDGDDVASAELYEKLAKLLEAKLEAAPPELPPAAPGAGVTVPREVLPREAMMPTEGMGEV